MINDIILGAWELGPIEILVFFLFLAIPIFLVFLAIKFVTKGSKERQKMQKELGRLTDELEQIRKQAEVGKKEK